MLTLLDFFLAPASLTEVPPATGAPVPAEL